MEGMIRTTPLSPEEKKELTNLLDKLKLAGKSSGQIVVHLNQGVITGIQPMPMLR